MPDALGDAVDACRRALTEAPADAGGIHVLGLLHLAAGRQAAAVAFFRRAVTLAPTFAEAIACLGEVLRETGQGKAAIETFRHALAYQPDLSPAQGNLAIALTAAGRTSTAAQCLAWAIRRDPGTAALWNNLGSLSRQAGFLDAAVEYFKVAWVLAPDYAEAAVNLGIARMDLAQPAMAAQCYERALRVAPQDRAAHRNLLACTLYRDDLDNRAIGALHRQFGPLHRRCLPPLDLLPPLTGKPLRIGYLSSDFRRHPMADSLLPMLREHDRTKLSLHLFAHLYASDDVTAQYRDAVDSWHEITRLSDDEVAALIRRERIDILVLLAGRFDLNRLTVAGMRAAPIQISLFDVATSGMAEMDYIISDARLSPRRTTEVFSERVLRLPCFHVASPPTDLPPIAAGRRGDFASFNNPAKITPMVLRAWGRILAARPDSRLTLKYLNRYASETLRRSFLAQLTAAGASPSQINFLTGIDSGEELLARYNDVAVALDSFPFSGSTTSFQALSMGIPVVTWPWDRMSSRWTAAMLQSIGLEELVADSLDAYVETALKVAGQRSGRQARRAEIRRRLLGSPLCDTASRTRHLERYYQAVWRRYVGSRAVLTEDYSRALAFYQSGQSDRSAALLGGILARDPCNGDSLHLLGLIDYLRGRGATGIQLIARAIAVNDRNAGHYCSLGTALHGLGEKARAVDASLGAIRLDPHYAAAFYSMALPLRDLGRLDGAIACNKRAITLLPAMTDAFNNLAVIAKDLGESTQATALYRRALAIQPGSAVTHSNLLYCLNYDPQLAAEQIFSEYRLWNEIHAKPLLPDSKLYANSREPGRRLRIGYVSSNYHQHSMRHFLEPLLARHDRTKFEIFAYADILRDDAVTRRYRDYVDHWRPVTELSDAALAETVRHDRIDILVDLAGHSAQHRLLAFARRPAPVQVSWIVAYGYTTGLDAIDYLLADASLAPTRNRSLFSENPVHLPVYAAYRPQPGMGAPGPLPALSAGHVTFGSLTRSVRINDRVAACWAAILRAVPKSRLILNSGNCGEGEIQRAILKRFADHGIAKDRLLLGFASPPWDVLRQIDIALDCFPHNSGTTLCEGLYMGLPTVTLADRPSVGRIGAAQLTALGRTEWIAADEQDYVRIAVDLAGDPGRLSGLRARLRQDMENSLLMDEKGFVLAIESAFQTMWQNWCRT